MVKIGRRYQEVHDRAPVIIVIEWRRVKGHPNYEITRDGVMRRYSTKKVLPSTMRGVGLFTYRVDGVKKTIAVSKLRNAAFPELGAW